MATESERKQLPILAACLATLLLLPACEDDPTDEDLFGGHAGWSASDAADVFADPAMDRGDSSFSVDVSAEADALSDQSHEAFVSDAHADAFGEPCVPDTCKAHGYVCGTLNDGCGRVVQCPSGADAWSLGWHCNATENLRCDKAGHKGLNFWACAGNYDTKNGTKPIGAPPFPDCEIIYFYDLGPEVWVQAWCCPETVGGC